jgi:hypothetical protein
VCGENQSSLEQPILDQKALPGLFPGLSPEPSTEDDGVIILTPEKKIGRIESLKTDSVSLLEWSKLYDWSDSDSDCSTTEVEETFELEIDA